MQKRVTRSQTADHRKVAMEEICSDTAENAPVASVSSLNLNQCQRAAINRAPTNTMKKADLVKMITKLEEERKKFEDEARAHQRKAEEAQAEMERLRAPHTKAEEAQAEFERLRRKIDDEARARQRKAEEAQAEFERQRRKANDEARAQQRKAEEAQAEFERQRKKAADDIARMQEKLNDALRSNIAQQSKLHEATEQLRLFKIKPNALITSALPPVKDLTSLVSSTSRAVERVQVTVINPMPGFKNGQRNFTLSILADLERKPEVTNFPEGALRNGERKAGSEQDLNSILETSAFFALNRLLDDVSSSSVALGGSKINADGATYLTHELKLLLLYKLKRHNLTAHGIDLVLNCNLKLKDPSDPHVSKDPLDAVQQLVGYMIIAKLRYGILTTYEYWWVVELCENKDVCISEAYCWSDTGPCSVLAMLHYVVHLARESVGKFAAPSLSWLMHVEGPAEDGAGPGPPGEDKENHGPNGRHKGGGSSGGSKGRKGQSKQAGAGGGKSACGAGGGGRSVFTFVRFLMDHPDRITFQARMTGVDGCKAGQLAAIKAYDTQEARDAEAARYKRLQGLRGVPQVLRERLGLVWSEAEEGRVHALVLSWVGPDDAGGERFSGARAAAALPARALAQVRATLVAMHGRGVAHGDVREDNVVWDAAAGQAYVVDLSHAATEGDAGAGFAAECCEDLCRAERLFAEAQAREGLAARFLR